MNIVESKYQYIFEALDGKSYPSNHQVALAVVGADIGFYKDIYKLMEFKFEAAFRIAEDVCEDISSAISLGDLVPVFVLVDDGDGDKIKKPYSSVVAYEDCYFVEFEREKIIDYVVKVIERKPESWRKRLEQVVADGPYIYCNRHRNSIADMSKLKMGSGKGFSTSESFNAAARSRVVKAMHSRSDKEKNIAFLIMIYVASHLGGRRLTKSQVLQKAEVIGLAVDGGSETHPSFYTIEQAYYKFWSKNKIQPSHLKKVMEVISNEDYPITIKNEFVKYTVDAMEIEEELRSWGCMTRSHVEPAGT